MGSVRCITPARFVNISIPVPRASIITTSANLAFLAFSSSHTYQKVSVQLEDTSEVLPEPKPAVEARIIDSFWMWNYLLEETPGQRWNRFMDAVTKRHPQEYETLVILPLPFVSLTLSKSYNDLHLPPVCIWSMQKDKSGDLCRNV